MGGVESTVDLQRQIDFSNFSCGQVEKSIESTVLKLEFYRLEVDAENPIDAQTVVSCAALHHHII
jgi:hypothetical protein